MQFRLFGKLHIDLTIPTFEGARERSHVSKWAAKRASLQLQSNLNFILQSFYLISYSVFTDRV